MRQNKYGVYLTRDGVDVNEWMTRSTALGQIGNSALSCYNLRSGTPSLVYIPKNESYGTNCFPEPLFLNVSSGNYAYSSKTGFIHAVFGNDAFGEEGYEERYAAEYIGSKAFTTTFSEDEARKIPSGKYALGDNGYLDIGADKLTADVCFDEDFVDISSVLDGLMSGGKTVVLGEPRRVLSAMVNALKILPSAEGANTVSFNTAATTADAAKLSRLSCGSYLKSDAIAQLKDEGCVIVDLNVVYDIDRLNSSTARIAREDRGLSAFKYDCPQSAVDCKEYLSAVENAAKRCELYKLSAKYASEDGCKNITERQLNHYLNLYNACVNDLRRPQYSSVKEAAENCLGILASYVLFGKKFFTLSKEQVTVLRGFLREIPALQTDAAADIAEYGSIDGIVRFLQMCHNFAEAEDKNRTNAAQWLCELFMSAQDNAKRAVKSFTDGIKGDDFLRLIKLLDVNCDLFVAYPVPQSGKMIQNRAFAEFKGESELRRAYNAVRNEFSRNTDWLLEKAFASIADVDDLENWIRTADGLKGKSYTEFASQFADAFTGFLADHPVDEQNYSAYRRAAVRFDYRNKELLADIDRIANSAESRLLFDRCLEDNLRCRREFVGREREFLTRRVKDDGEVEKEVYGSLYRKSRSFGGAFLMWLLAALAIGVALAGVAVLIKNSLNLPWTEFFTTLKHPVTGVPINAILTFVPFVLSVAVSMLTYVFGKDHEGKGLLRSLLCTLLTVTVPYLVFVLGCGAVYYLL